MGHKRNYSTQWAGIDPHMQKMIDAATSNCKDCVYYCKSAMCCGYFEIAGERRPCPPNEECTVKMTPADARARKKAEKRKAEEEKASEAKKDNRLTVDYARMRDMYKKGATDIMISTDIGCSMSTVYRWRQSNRLRPNKKKRR